jgi:hypothetical protein
VGHNILPRLPATKSWEAVVALIDSSASNASVVSETARAAERSFLEAPKDPVYAEAVRLMVQLAASGSADAFDIHLRQNGIAVPKDPSLEDVLQALGTQLDRVATDTRASDLGELARRALVSTVHEQINDRLPRLLEPEAGDLQAAVSRLSGPRAFGFLARQYFTRFTVETLSYWLDRELPAHLGPDQRFEDLKSRREFSAAIEQYASEASRIISDFCEHWYARAVLEDQLGARTPAFAAVALKKIRKELERKRGVDG